MNSSGDTAIARRPFGHTDLIVSEYGLGCARIGGIFQRDPADFLNLLSAAFHAGINFFDTADMYSQGESERLLGRAFKHRRDQVVIASKAGFILPARRQLIGRIKPLVRPLIRLLKLRRQNLVGAAGALAQDFSPAHLRRGMEGSLRRLSTDHLDLFQLHSPPTEIIAKGEWMETLESMKREGKIRYWGISCDSIEAGTAVLEHPGASSLQIVVNLLEREAIKTLLPPARARGVAVIARECLANGMLVKDPSTIDFASYTRSTEEARHKAALVESYRQQAAARGCTVADLALEFVNALDGVSVSIIGVSSMQHLRSLLSGEALSGRPPGFRSMPRVV